MAGLKPLIKYRGGKSKEIVFFEDLIPTDYSRYIEPFLGGGALFFHLCPKSAIVNDLNVKLIDFYKGVRNDYDILMQDLAQLESLYKKNQSQFLMEKNVSQGAYCDNRNEALYYSVRDMFNGKTVADYSDAALYFFINKTAYSGMIRYNSKGEYNVPFGRYKNFSTSCITELHSKLLKRAKVCNDDYTKIFNMSKSDDFIFIDPPYDCVFTDYGNYGDLDFDEDKQRKLAENFKNLSCKAMIVIGKTPLIMDLYHGYTRREYEKKYAVNIRNRFKAQANHLVITNY